MSVRHSVRDSVVKLLSPMHENIGINTAKIIKKHFMTTCAELV